MRSRAAAHRPAEISRLRAPARSREHCSQQYLEDRHSLPGCFLGIRQGLIRYCGAHEKGPDFRRGLSGGAVADTVVSRRCDDVL